MSDVPGAGYRRNGKPRACEPCRKGKLACDHGSPFCGRCTRRKITGKCIYHPAPMTRTTRARAKSMPSSSVVEQSTGGSIGTSNMSLASQGNQNIPVDAATSGQPKIGWKDMVFRRSTRYLGPTSYSAVFSENKTKLEADLLDIGDDKRQHPGAWKFGVPLLGRHRPSAPTIRESQTLRVLKNLPPEEVCYKLLRPLHSTVLNIRIIRHILDSLWSNHRTELTRPHVDDRLVVLSDVLFRNEESPLQSPPYEPLEWLNTFSGSNLRFETLGILFCFLGVSYLSLQDWDPLFTHPDNEGRNRKETVWRMKECAELCLKMCEYSETINYLVAALILVLKRVDGGCAGNDTYSMRQLHGQLVTMTVTSGLHKLPNYMTARFTAALEYKRRLFCEIYANDKAHASLNGVPPLLTRRFCDLHPCLDLPDDALLFAEHELSHAVSLLDDEGWNTSGQDYQYTTLLRALVQHTTILEEILELALGTNVEISQASIDDLHARSHQLYRSLPTQLHYHVAGEIRQGGTGIETYDRATLYLRHLQNSFLIDRLATARGLPNEQGLLETSLTTLEVSLMLWNKRDQLPDFLYAFDWIMTYYAVPSSGVICIQLLKAQSSLQFSRSNAIQKLTLFIAFLEWIRPTDGNYALAQRLQKVIRRVLDHVLDQPPQQIVAASSEVIIDPMLPDLGTFEEMEDLDWLNTVDWTQGFWMD